MDDTLAIGEQAIDLVTDVADADAVALTDEEAARQSRQQYREHGLPTLEADSVVGPLLAADETIAGLRAGSGLSRIDPTTQKAVRANGMLYVTNRRLLHIAESHVTSVALTDVAELAMADDRILVTTKNSGGLVLDVQGPRQLRVLIAAAKGALRG